MASSAYQLQQHPHASEFSAVNHPSSGGFGESQWFDTITMENASPSPPPLELWPNCSMFMVATEPWPSGTSSRSVTTGEQLNTPQPANGDIGGFDFESVFGGDSGRPETSQQRAAKVNLTNVFSKHDINGITKNEGEDFNNNSGNNGKGNDSSSLQQSGLMEPLFSNHKESVITAGFDSWEFEPCLEETLLSPISYVATPHHSTGVASPGSSSGDTYSPNHRRSLQESETCVDFNSILFSPSSPIVEASEEDDLCAGNLHEEIEQLSSSFYCTSNSLVSVHSAALTTAIDDVSPSLIRLLQEEDQPLTAAPLQQQQQPPSQPSVAANSYFSDATNDGEDEQQQQHVERKQTVEVVADDETLDVKTQTQLEHNYTIQLPSGEGTNPAAAFKKQTTTVKEENLALLAKARETLKPQTTVLLQQQQQQYRRPPISQQSVKRQLLQRMKSRMAASSAAVLAAPVRKVPNLKLKIMNAGEARVVDDSAGLLTTTQVVLNTPDLTENLLDLEDEFLIKEDNFDLLEYIDSATGYDVIHSPKEEKPVINFTEPAPASSTSTNITSSKLCGPTLSDLFNPAKRKLPTITIESLDELTASTNAGKRFRSSAASSSTASSVCGDNGSEASASTKPTKRRGRPPKPVASVRDRSEYEHLSEADMRYREQRDKNNEASRKSRINRKDRESKLEEEASELIEKYEVLEGKERELIRECARWRKAVMRLALL